MIKEIPKAMIAEVPENLRFYKRGSRVVQVDISKAEHCFCSLDRSYFKTGDVVQVPGMLVVILGTYRDECYPKPILALYDDISERIVFYYDTENWLEEGKRVGSIKL